MGKFDSTKSITFSNALMNTIAEIVRWLLVAVALVAVTGVFTLAVLFLIGGGD